MSDNIYRYNLPFMNQTIGVIASITMVCYIMYTVNQDVMDRFNTQYLFTTSFFVLAGIIRYLQLTIVDVKSGSPTKVFLQDHFLQVCILGWVMTFFLLIYLWFIQYETDLLFIIIRFIISDFDGIIWNWWRWCWIL